METLSSSGGFNNPFSSNTMPAAQANALAAEQAQLRAQAQQAYRSLSIASMGPATLDNAKARTFNFTTRPTNRTDDIEGSRPHDKHARFANKYANVQTELDPQTIRAKPAIHARNTRDLSLYIDDIEGTRCINKDRMALTNRHVNPLNPSYPLPASVQAQPEVPKFIRDEMYFDDIVGSRSKPLYKPYTRDIISVNDIEGSAPGWKPRNEMIKTAGAARDLLQTEDVSRKTHRYIDRTHRHGDSLDPQYTIHGLQVKDEAKYTKPRPCKPYIADNHLLMTSDIPGATPKVSDPQQAALLNPNRRGELRNLTSTADIAGAQADTHKHTIVTRRQTNPLQPTYQDLDAGEPLRPIVDSLLPVEIISQPNIRFPPGYISNQPVGSGSRTGGGHRPSSNTTSLFNTTTNNNSNTSNHNNNNNNINFDMFSASATAPAPAPAFGSFDMFSLPALNLGGGNSNNNNNNNNDTAPAPTSSVSYASKVENDIFGNNNNNNNGRRNSGNNNTVSFDLNSSNQGSNNNNNNNMFFDFNNFQKPPTPQINFGNNNNNNNNSDNNRGPPSRSQSAKTSVGGGAIGVRGSSPRVNSASSPSPRANSSGNNNGFDLFANTTNHNGGAPAAKTSGKSGLGIAERKASAELRAEIEAIRML